MQTTFPLTLLALTAAIIAPVASLAATVTYSVPGTALSGANGLTVASVALPQFNPALGTLTGVQFDVSQSDTVTLAFENLTLPGTAGSAQSNIVELKDGATTLVSSPVSISYSEPVVPPFDGSLDFGGASGTTTTPTILTNSSSGPGVPASYIGGGTHTFTLQRTAIANPIAPAGGFVLLNNASGAIIDVSVTYTYTPIPEPAGSALGLMAGLAALVRRRRA